MHSELASRLKFICIMPPIWWVSRIATGSVSRRVSSWRHQENGLVQYSMNTCLVGSECATHSVTVSYMLKFPIYWLGEVVHLRHEKLNIRIISWWGAGWLCRGVSDILLVSRAWQPGRVGSFTCPQSFPGSFLFSIFGKTVVPLFLTCVEMLPPTSHIVTCWM